MGSAKNAMMERESDLAAAASYLVRIDTLQQCEAHGEIFGGGYWKLEDDFWKKVMSDRNRGNNGPVPWAESMTSREFTDLLKDAYDAHPGDGCGYCAKNMAE